MYAAIDKKFIETNKANATTKAEEEYGDEESSKNTYLWTELKDVFDEVYEGDGKLLLSFKNELGYFSIDVPLDDDVLLQILTLIQKRMNKFKTVIEGLK